MTEDFTRLLTDEDRAVREMRIEWEKFFNGSRTVPPEELRDEIQSEIRALRNSNLRGVAENFRLSQVEARFNSFSELYGRRLHQVEEGRGPLAVVATRRGPELDPRRGVELGESLDPAAVEALYHGLSRGPGAGPRFDLESFRGYLAKQVGTLRARTGRRQDEVEGETAGGLIGDRSRDRRCAIVRIPGRQAPREGAGQDAPVRPTANSKEKP